MRKFLPLFLLVASLAVSTPVFAQEKAAEKPAEESPMTMVFKWFNLIVLLGAAGYLLKKPASEFFETRKKEITSGLDRAKAAQEESDRRMREIEQRLGRLSSEIASLRTQADAESGQEREHILAEAKRDVARLVDQSRQEIDRIARGIERDIKEKIADAVIDRAGRTLETQMTEDDQKRVVVRFLNKV